MMDPVVDDESSFPREVPVFDCPTSPNVDSERWAPLGANDLDDDNGANDTAIGSDGSPSMEEQYESMTKNLIQLTTHFAQVQFRLRQVTLAPEQSREALLKELEDFTFKGVPELQVFSAPKSDSVTDDNDDARRQLLDEQKQKQKELISHLKKQLTDLETFAYQSGTGDLPTALTLEKQQLILSELQQKLNLQLISTSESVYDPDSVKNEIDHVINETVVYPTILKDKLVSQLRTQVQDLEKFVEFLQNDEGNNNDISDKNCDCSKTGDIKPAASNDPSASKTDTNDQIRTMLKRSLALAQMFLITNLGCGHRDFETNILKKTEKGNHWGDLRARTELVMNRIRKLAEEQPLLVGVDRVEELVSPTTPDSPTPSNASQKVRTYSTASGRIDFDNFYSENCDIVDSVRKDLAPALKDLAQHGMLDFVSDDQSVVRIGCFASRNTKLTRSEDSSTTHAWCLLLKFYRFKNGPQYQKSAQRSLSDAFRLDNVAGKPVTSKQTLLSTISDIEESFGGLRRYNAKWKAFVCLGLNERKLGQWLRVLFRSGRLVDSCYQPWSYVARTKFEDTCSALDELCALPHTFRVAPYGHNQKPVLTDVY